MESNVSDQLRKKRPENINGQVVDILVTCLREGKRVLTFGVGGNAANAIHFAAELAGKYEKFEKPLSCSDLLNISTVTAIATDYGWENVFSRQILGQAKPGDVVLAFSISTKGTYLKNALMQALMICKAILICGKNTLEFSSPNLTVWELNSLDTPWVQEEQLKLIHRICGTVKATLEGL